jgi:cobalt/nickel transport system permease protein
MHVIHGLLLLHTAIRHPFITEWDNLPFGDTVHIPDGYLGPYTYVALYLVMIPIWAHVGRKLSQELRSKQVPLLALSAAFSFVIMMFNLPVPGGSTGHAIGGAIIGIVLGPWAAVISISVALILQALIFGDGGITAIGANCFNMAVVMPFSAYYLYRMFSGNSDIDSSRRLAAAAIAGYISLVLAAAVTGFEFGIQPLLHYDAGGVPLYMPYGLNVTMTAMVLEHLVFGFVEALVTILIFAYIRRTDPSLLMDSKPKSEKRRENVAVLA